MQNDISISGNAKWNGVMKLQLFAVCLVINQSCSRNGTERIISTGSLLYEMTDLQRLPNLPDHSYKTIQFSSYDRRSVNPTEAGWFSNDDGFGGEAVPGFEKVLKEPDSSGIGEYLICNVHQPGAIIRLWSAGISGKIRLFLDDMNTPFYDGDAQDFMWKTLEALTGKPEVSELSNHFRQFDAMYLPVPFARGCRMEWIGDIHKIHFYHVGIRIYTSPVSVSSFKKMDIDTYQKALNETGRILNYPEKEWKFRNSQIQVIRAGIPADSTKVLFEVQGSEAMEYFSLKLNAADLEAALRGTVLNIYFDQASIPQVQSPVGDFFGAAPGINPYTSLPFSVQPDGTMTCRFIMPFRQSVRIEIENHSGRAVDLTGGIRLTSFEWKEGQTMHFYARWKISHNLTASNTRITDIPYIMAFGKGRLVGAAAYVYNPSNVPASWGNWWGEGDEKIYTDQDSFPSFFGTGSEDYFNYSWSSARIFSHAYCGQPRNDGPGNRGYVANFRWHISDDILFYDKLAFYMELQHHGEVPGFTYGRLVYLYALPGMISDFQEISMDDIRKPGYLAWNPVAYLGSEGFRFIPAEDIISPGSSIKVVKGNRWAGGSICMWSPGKLNESISMHILCDQFYERTNIGFTLAHMPEGGKLCVFINRKPVKFDGNEMLDLASPYEEVIDNHFSEPVSLRKGRNEVRFQSMDSVAGRKVGLDFLWLRQK